MVGICRVMKIFKNYIDSETFNTMKDVMLSEDFIWFFRSSQVSWEDKDYSEYFSHTFYVDEKINSDSYKLMLPVIDKLKPKALIQMRANLVVQKHDHFKSEFHTDFDFKCNTAIFYLNTNNGYTEFENGEIVKCEENTLVTFDSQIKHRAVSQTDTKQRVVVNINYF